MVFYLKNNNPYLSILSRLLVALGKKLNEKVALKPYSC